MKKESGSNWSLLLILRFGYGVSPADLALLLHCMFMSTWNHFGWSIRIRGYYFFLRDLSDIIL